MTGFKKVNVLWYLWLVVFEHSRPILQAAILFDWPKEREHLAFSWFFSITLLPCRAVSGTLSPVVGAVIEVLQSYSVT